MYFRPTDYPELRDMKPADRHFIVRRARERYCGWFAARLWMVAITTLLFVYLISRFYPSFLWGLLVFAIMLGYLLWECNGNLHRAVRAYLHDNPDPLLDHACGLEKPPERK